MSRIKKKAAPKDPEQMIYCGPNVPGGALQRYTVFKGGIPGHLDNLIKECPAIKKLCVPVFDFAKTKRSISTKGTPESSFYQQVLKFVNKGGV